MATAMNETPALEPVAVFPWWLILLQGICAAIIGFLLLTETAVTLATLVVLLGIYWFVLGVLDIARMFSSPRGWGWSLFSGILGILAGLVLIRHPLWSGFLTTSVLVWIIGGLGLVMGAVGIVRAITGGGWGMAIGAVLSILLGLLLIFHTGATIVVLVYTAGVMALIGGILGIIGAIALRVRLGSGAKRLAY